MLTLRLASQSESADSDSESEDSERPQLQVARAIQVVEPVGFNLKFYVSQCLCGSGCALVCQSY